MLAHGKTLSEFWGLPSLLRAASRRRPKKSCTKLAKCQKSKLFFAAFQPYFFSLLFIAFSVYSTGCATRGARRWEGKTVVDVNGKWPENTYVCLSCCPLVLPLWAEF